MIHNDKVTSKYQSPEATVQSPEATVLENWRYEQPVSKQQVEAIGVPYYNHMPPSPIFAQGPLPSRPAKWFLTPNKALVNCASVKPSHAEPWTRKRSYH